MAGDLEKEAFEQGTKVAQIFSGIFFSGLAAWLTVTNGTKLAFVQRASLEKRLTVCCFLNTYVGFFSAFFNFFQLTSVDDMLLPDGSSYTLDLARPIEWLMTCPLMQLVLVLMGGAKIPEYRRYAMPLFSVVILLCGTTGSLQGFLWARFLIYGLGCVLYGAMFYFNRMQILEYSGGDEGIFMGDSEFRKATLLLLSTWSPFPIWYLLSPEGLGIVDNVLIVQVGWAFLNIVAKFVFIFYIQRIKDLYCNRLKTKRELQGGRPGFGVQQRLPSASGAMSPVLEGPGGADFAGPLAPDYETAIAYEQADAERKKGQLSAVVVETMSFLGMAQHTDRFMRLLDRANISNISEVEALSKDHCTELQLPWDLVSALQRRLRVWKLEMVDDAEMGLDRGEEHYIKKALDMPPMDPMDAALNNLRPNFMPPGLFPDGADSFLRQVSGGISEACVEELFQKQDHRMLETSKTSMKALQAAIAKIVTDLSGELRTVESRLMDQLKLVSKTTEQRGELRAMENRVHAKLDELKNVADDIHHSDDRLEGQVEQQFSLISTKLDANCQRLEHFSQKVDFFEEKVVGAAQKSEVGFKAQEEHIKAEASRLEASLGARLIDLGADSRASLEPLGKKLEALQAAGAKVAAESTANLKRSFEELEAHMLAREEEKDAAELQRHEELLKNSAGRKVDELATQVQRAADRSEAALDSVKSSLEVELQASTSRLSGKVETIQSSVIRHLTDSESATQQRLEQALEQASAKAAQAGALQAAQRAEKAVEELGSSVQKHVAQAVSQAAEQGAAQSSRLAEKAVAALEPSLAARIDSAASRAASAGEQAVAAQLESGLQRRLDDAVSRAVHSGAQQAAQHVAHRTEQAVEALESSQRSDLSSAIGSLRDWLADVQSSQQMKLIEREERGRGRIEELVQLTTTRYEQKVDDIGIDIKKELHGFAKRLNSKINFM